MSSRTTLRPHLVINSVTMAGDITSEVTVLQSLTKASYGISWTGSTPVGTVSVQVSNDYSLNQDGTVANAGTWNTLTLDVAGVPVTTIAVSGNTGNGFIDIDATAAYAIRLIYTRGSGTGTMKATVVGKVS